MTAATKTRLLIVHADPVSRQGLARLLGQHALVEVVGSAMSGRTALPKIVTYRPECVVIDLEQNEGEGLELLEYLHRSHPGIMSLAVVCPRSREDLVAKVQGMPGVELLRREADAAEHTLTRLAADLVASLLRRTMRAPLVNPEPPLRAAVHPVEPSPRAAGNAAATSPIGITTATSVAAAVESSGRPAMPALVMAGRAPRVVGIGVSTGGPKALTQLLPSLPADFPLPIVVVQHMPPKFTKSLAESLDKVCQLRVREAEANDRVERGTILIAPGGMHLRIVAPDGNPVARLTEDPPECSCRPSVDYLFRSLVEVFGGRMLGVVLTGMGEDGWVGSRLIREAGGQVLAQDEASSTVYGMPRGPIEAGIARAVPLERMAEAVLQVVRGVPCS